FYNENYIPYEVILWKKLISKIANYFYQDNDKKYNFLSERKLQYVYKNNITLKGRYDLKYSINNNHYLVDFKTGYTDSRSNVLTGVSLQLPFYSILDNNINFFEYLSLNVSKNSIKSTVFEKDDFYDSTNLIFNTLDTINSLILNKKKLLVRKSSSGCEICGHEDLNRL
ncbi:MAG: PD-(D/E)XK nuclease family protein, partial [Gammaproteobacteria bacterium]